MSSQDKPKLFVKTVGSRKDVIEGIACKTAGGLTVDDLFVDQNGVIKSKKQAESLKARKGLEHHEPQGGSSNVAPVVEESDHEEVSVKAIPKAVYKLDDIKFAVTQALAKNNMDMPKNYSKWRKQEWLEFAESINAV
jgi:hypothetical protein